MDRVTLNSLNETKVIIDMSFIYDLMDADEMESKATQYLTSVVNLFIEHFPERISKMRDFAQTDNLHAMSKVAHTSKSSCGNLGVISMASICQTLENFEEEFFSANTSEIDKKNPKAAILKKIDELENEFSQVKSILTEIAA